MGLFSFLAGPDINQGIRQYEDTNNAILLDVRTPEEYKNGHISESVNLPLQNISEAEKRLTDKKSASVCILSQRRTQPAGGFGTHSNGI